MDNKQSYLNLTQYKRVLQYAKFPDSEEVYQVSKIAGLGIFLIGTLGFLIFALMQFLPG